MIKSINIYTLTWTITLFFMVSGCSIQRYVLDPSSTREIARVNKQDLFFFHGILQTKTTEGIAKECDGKVSYIEHKEDIISILIRWVVPFGILTPRNVAIVCS